MNNQFNRFYYSILYAVIGDIIGYGNGNIEFNDGTPMNIKNYKDIERLSGISTMHVVKFISNGGLYNYNFKKYLASDDSILLLSILDALIVSYNKDNQTIIETIKKYMIKYFEEDKLKDKRNYGFRTVKSFISSAVVMPALVSFEDRSASI